MSLIGLVGLEVLRMGRRPMGELETAVMDVLWDSGGWMTPGEVHEALPGERELAYNTVMTILVRLWEKGRLERERDGRAYAYRPLQTREEHAAAAMGQSLMGARDRPLALSRFVETLNESDRAQLRRMLRGRSGDGAG